MICLHDITIILTVVVARSIVSFGVIFFLFYAGISHAFAAVFATTRLVKLVLVKGRLTVI